MIKESDQFKESKWVVKAEKVEVEILKKKGGSLKIKHELQSNVGQGESISFFKKKMNGLTTFFLFTFTFNKRFF